METSFNPDPNKQVPEVIFSSKLNKSNHTSLNLNNMVVIQSRTRKNVGMMLNTKLGFEEHHNEKLSKIRKITGLLRKLQKILTRPLLLTVCWPLLDPMLIMATPYMKSKKEDGIENLLLL